MKTPFLMGIAAGCLLLAGCGQSESLTRQGAQRALDGIPHNSGSATFSKIRVQHPNQDAIVEANFTDFGYITNQGKTGKYTGAGTVLFTNPKEGEWHLRQVHLGDPPIDFNYDGLVDQSMALPGWLTGSTSRWLYQVCAAIFMFQGVAIPFVVIAAGLAWYPQNRRMRMLGRHLVREQDMEDAAAATPDLILQKLPKLQPLNCPTCGGGVLLKKHDTFCPHCQKHGELPLDYAALAPIRRHLENLTKRALRYWRVDYALTRPFMERTFKVLIWAEALLFPVVLIGDHLFPKTWVERYFDWLGKDWLLAMSLSAFFGLAIWMLLLFLLGWLSRDLRKNLPEVPTLPPSAAGQEIVNCRDCGGTIEYAEGAFAAVCPYCHVINVRAQLVHRERALSKQNKTKSKSILFGAMEVLDDFIGTFFFISVLLVLISLFVVAYRGCEIYVHKTIPSVLR